MVGRSAAEVFGTQIIFLAKLEQKVKELREFLRNFFASALLRRGGSLVLQLFIEK